MTNQATASIASGDPLDVRRFRVEDRMSRLFVVQLQVVSSNLDIEFDDVIGNDASFSLGTLLSTKTWRGVCIEMDQVRVDSDGLATYTLTLAPRAYLMTLRKNYRVFQYKPEIDIVAQILGEWGIAHRVEVDRALHKPRKYRVQYGESDFTFVCRMLEDAGISFFFEDAEGESTMVLSDHPEQGDVEHAALRFHDHPGVTDGNFVTKLAVGQRVRPGKMTIGDLDYRKPSVSQPRLSATGGLAPEGLLEQFDYEPGAFLYEGGSGGSTPSADDRGVTRTDEGAGQQKTQNRLHGKRQDAKTVRFDSNVLVLGPGSILSIASHPHPLVGQGTLLATSAVLEGEHNQDWRVAVESVSTELPFRPQTVTPKPRAPGIESATVVGGSVDEIHTDEYARVRVHFHWDRESGRNESSSCWVPTNQPWAGAGFGGVVLPRVGQEVLVEFLGGDPDRPVVVGRVFTESQPPPYRLPEGKRLTALIGKSSPHLVAGASDGYPSHSFEDVFRRSWSDPAFAANPPESYRDAFLQQNAFVVGDSQGQEITYLEARKDLNILVKNKWTAVIGNYRGCFVGGDDLLHIKNKQKIEVKESQYLRVFRDQQIVVGKLREERVDKNIALTVLSDHQIKCEGTIDYKAKEGISIKSEEAVRFEVGESSITVTRSTIVIDSPVVHFNP